MDYSSVAKKTGTHFIADHLRGFLSGEYPKEIGKNLRANINYLKWGRPAEIQKFITGLIDRIPKEATIEDKALVTELLNKFAANRIINGAPETFKELWEQEEAQL